MSDKHNETKAALLLANKELALQNKEQAKCAEELGIANKELLYQNEEKAKRADELIIANKELAFQNEEKAKRAAELIIANKELAFQNEEKAKRADELIIANKELLYQNEEKAKRADELIAALKECAYLNQEKDKRAAELVIANKELVNKEEEVKALTEFLEQKVIRRTVELAKVNGELMNAIADGKIYESKLFEHLQMSTAMLDNNPDVIGRFDKDFRYLYINHPITTERNETREWVIGKTLRDRGFSDEITRAYEDAHQHVFATGKEKTIEVPIIIKGDLHYFESRWTPEFATNGTVASALCISRDITPRKRMEKEIEEHTAQLITANKELEQYTYLTSHDLREPLLTIHSFINLIQNEHSQGLDDDAKRYLKLVSQASVRMDSLIKGLLDYSRLSNAKHLNDGVDCNEILKEVHADLLSLITKNNALISVDKLPIIKAFPLEIKLLFLNLITNAIKFRKKEIDPEIHISFTKISNGWQFSIKDNGIGIEEKGKEKIFLIFQRLHKRKDYEGTGIGLAFCKKIAELHGGRIWVESIPGESSTFYFTILTE